MRRITILLLAALLLPGIVLGAEPYPPYPPSPPPPPPRTAAPPRPYPPRVVAPPPPLSPVTRAIYAPFYAAGLVVRYGVYYLLVAPIAVRTRGAKPVERRVDVKPGTTRVVRFPG